LGTAGAAGTVQLLNGRYHLGTGHQAQGKQNVLHVVKIHIEGGRRGLGLLGNGHRGQLHWRFDSQKALGGIQQALASGVAFGAQCLAVLVAVDFIFHGNTGSWLSVRGSSWSRQWYTTAVVSDTETPSAIGSDQIIAATSLFF